MDDREKTGLTPEVLLALQAAATAGPTFDAGLVAALLDVPAMELLRRLQMARDAGVPLDDRGDGTFALPHGAAEALRGEVLPSLAAAWRTRIAALRGDVAVTEAPRSVPGPATDLFAPPEPAELPEDFEWPPGASVPWPREPSAGMPQPEGRPGIWDEAEAPAAWTDEWPEPPGAAPEPDGIGAAEPVGFGAVAPSAGAPLDAVATRLLRAAESEAAAGRPGQAVTRMREALAHLESRPGGPPPREVRVRLLLELARFQWEGVASQPGLALADAQATAREAAALVEVDATPALALDAFTLYARVLYDIGDPASLQEAARVLAAADRALTAAGDERGAARLLNDQAAVWVRLGDPRRAQALLASSRRAFEALGARDPVAARELAETDLLLARLPLHFKAAPGRDETQLAAAVQHATAAVRVFWQLHLPREAGRAWETLGRLELRRGNRTQADTWLRWAADVQRDAGDALGLAATAEALARLLGGAGRFDEALTLLSESADLNARKGATRGVAYVHRALVELASAAAARGADPRLADAFRRLEARLEAMSA
jgi:tetratricopeptide (TPR) repeat protein